MSDPRTDRVEVALRAVAARLDVPPVPPIAPAVGARLRADAAQAHRPPFVAIATWPRRRVIVAIALSILLLATAAAAGRLAIGAVRVEVVRTPLPSAPAEAPSSFGADLSLAQASRLTVLRPGWPPSLGRPDDVYVVSAPGSTQRGLVLAWRDAPGLAPIPDTPWNAVLFELPGDVGIATKYVGAYDIHAARVHGTRGFWISGPHDLTFAGQPTVRVNGNVLVWQRAPSVTYRLETTLPKSRAIALAEELPLG